jgi:esterase/lipase superfamily enzyme
VLYDNSPTDFLANMPADHQYIEIYNAKKIILCVGQGRWEEEGRRTTEIMRDIFKEKNILAQTDFWGYDVDHDWFWWKKQILYFLPEFLKEAT